MLSSHIPLHCPRPTSIQALLVRLASVTETTRVALQTGRHKRTRQCVPPHRTAALIPSSLHLHRPTQWYPHRRDSPTTLHDPESPTLAEHPLANPTLAVEHRDCCPRQRQASCPMRRLQQNQDWSMHPSRLPMRLSLAQGPHRSAAEMTGGRLLLPKVQGL